MSQDQTPAKQHRRLGCTSLIRGITTLLLGTAFVVLARPATAQDDGSAAEVAAARAIALDGIKLADAGRCGDAVEKLARAEKLHHAPVVLGRLGECQIVQGKLVEGTENLRKVLREPLAANATPVLLKARERAQAALDAARPRIASTTVAVKGPRDLSSVTVTFDGQPMPAALLDAERPTDPGEHLVEASSPGYLKGSARLNVSAGEKQSVTLRLDPDPNAAAAVASSTGEAAPSALPTASLPGANASLGEATPSATREPQRSAAYVTWAVGGAAIVAGSIFGGLALKAKSDLAGDCPNDVCVPEAQGRLDSARRSSTVSNVLFAVGGAGLVIGTVLYFTASPSANSAGVRKAGRGVSASDANAPRAHAWLGVGQVGVSGQF